MDHDLLNIKQLFLRVSPLILNLVNQKFDSNTLVKQKEVDTDYATQIDLDCENVIVSEIKKSFPNDRIMAEEGYSQDQDLSEGRVWIIDPICGTDNLLRGVKFFCSNIALIENGKFIASCVIDHSRDEFIWSTGENKVYINEMLFNREKKDKGYKIEADFGALHKATESEKEQFLHFIEQVIKIGGVKIMSMNTSLSFAYLALGRLDGFFCPSFYLWDIASAIFLIEQSGGVVTDTQGQRWSWRSKNAIAGVDETSHAKLISFLN